MYFVSLKSYKEIEQRDVIIADTVAEIIDDALNKIIQIHTDRLAVKKAVQDATGILSDALRLYFVSCDQGYKLTCNYFFKSYSETLGFEAELENHDLPPKSSKTDSWARGRVEVVKAARKEVRSQSRVSAGINVAFPPSTASSESEAKLAINPSGGTPHQTVINEKIEHKKEPKVLRVNDNTKIRQNVSRIIYIS